MNEFDTLMYLRSLDPDGMPTEPTELQRAEFRAKVESLGMTFSYFHTVWD